MVPRVFSDDDDRCSTLPAPPDHRRKGPPRISMNRTAQDSTVSTTSCWRENLRSVHVKYSNGFRVGSSGESESQVPMILCAWQPPRFLPLFGVCPSMALPSNFCPLLPRRVIPFVNLPHNYDTCPLLGTSKMSSLHQEACRPRCDQVGFRLVHQGHGPPSPLYTVVHQLQ